MWAEFWYNSSFHSSIGTTPLKQSTSKNPLLFFIFFLISKKTSIIERKFLGVHKTWTTRESQNKTTKTYLHPNHARKSRTEFVLALLNRLAQAHKLDIKLILILWAVIASFSNANLFLAHHRAQNIHEGAAVHIFFRFFPTAPPCQAKSV